MNPSKLQEPTGHSVRVIIGIQWVDNISYCDKSKTCSKKGLK